MGDRYLDSGNGSPSTPFESEATAATTLADIIADPLLAGEKIFVANDHSENPGGNITYTFPGTFALPNHVISATLSGPTYTKATAVQVNNITSTHDITLNGVVNFYGVSLSCGDDLIMNGTGDLILFDDCVLELTGTTSIIDIGSSAGQCIVNLKNTDVNFSGGGGGTGFKPEATSIFDWRGGTLSWTGTQPTALMNVADRTVFWSFSGVDLSVITSALVDVSDAADLLVEFHHCLLNSGVIMTTGTIASIGTKVLMSGCDDATGNDLYRLEYVNYYGSVVHDDAIFVTTGGASDGTTPISWKMESNGNAAKFFEPLISPPITKRRKVLGSESPTETTLTIKCLTLNGVLPDNDQMWMEVEFLPASQDTQSNISNDGLADPLEAAAPQTLNNVAWDGSESPSDTFELSVTVPINRIGPFICRVFLAEPNFTAYIDPLVTVT